MMVPVGISERAPERPFTASACRRSHRPRTSISKTIKRSSATALRSPPGDAAVLLVTFALTVAFDLTIAIEVGVLLAAFLFMHRMSAVVALESHVPLVEDDTDDLNRAPSGDQQQAGGEGRIRHWLLQADPRLSQRYALIAMTNASRAPDGALLLFRSRRKAEAYAASFSQVGAMAVPWPRP